MIEIYVAPNGSGDGSDSSPCSLEKAKKLVRNINRDMSSDINVYIDEGTYFLSTPFVLSHEDSGSNGFKIRWRNNPGTKPIFSGAQIITNWSLHDAEQNIWKASMPQGLNFEYLWINGKRLRRAWSGWNPKGFKNTRKGVKIIDPIIDISNWKNINDIVVTKKFIWRHIPCKVHQIKDRRLILNPKCVQTYKIPQSCLGVLNQAAII